jgi:hypothetical protein
MMIPTVRYSALPTSPSHSRSFARIVQSAPAIRLASMPNRLASTSLKTAERLFNSNDFHNAMMMKSNRSGSSSPRGFYTFAGVPVQHRIGSIDAFQWGARDTRALRMKYFHPDNVPRACVHENVQLTDAALQRDAEAVFDELQSVCNVLLRQLVNVDDRIAPLINAPFDSYVEFKRYSVGAEMPPTASVMMNEHRDQTLLTLLIQSPAPTAVELQVKSASDASEKWLSTTIASDVDDESAIVHVGDLLERATHGRFLSTVHRVVSTLTMPPPPKERFSVALFCMPSWHVHLDESTQVGDLLPVYE